MRGLAFAIFHREFEKGDGDMLSQNETRLVVLRNFARGPLSKALLVRVVLLGALIFLSTACNKSNSSSEPPPAPPTPAAAVCPNVNVAYAVDTANQLVCFSLSAPGTIDAVFAITGIGGAESIVGIDFRPATGELYAMGSTGQLYVINKGNGVAAPLGTALAYPGAAHFGFDFNPVVDRIRVVTDNGINLRLNPLNGTLVATDTPLAYAGGDSGAGIAPKVVASAYLNNFAGTLTTTLYGIDYSRDVLVMQNPPNNGTLNTVGPLGFNTDVNTSFDIQTNAAGTSNFAYAVLTAPSATTSRLVTIDLATGNATLVDLIGGGVAIRAFAIAP